VLKPRAIVVHCSASRWGDARAIDRWHRSRGWSGIGYHAVILNGRRHASLDYNPRIDGKIEPGRPENVEGAHCLAGGMNDCALGVCLIGTPGWDDYATGKQIDALVHYLTVKCAQYGIPVQAITQHSDHEPGKPHCASLDMKRIRQLVAQRAQRPSGMPSR
jgi:N-acetylmuramoyl-L-alanine amidase